MVTIPKNITPEIAEIAGIFAADGSMQKNHICFWGNIREDVEYYNGTIKTLFKKAFNIDINPHPKKSNSVYGFYICNKKIIRYFNEVLGFSFGNKTYTVRIPKIIMDSKDPKIWTSFIRGVFDNDGCLNFDKRRGTCQEILKIIHTYPRIHLASTSHNLIKDIVELLERIKIPHCYGLIRKGKKNKKDYLLLQVSGNSRLENWMNLIGFNNPVQITRYEIFKKHGFVPVNTDIVTRKKILKGEIDPWNFYPKRACSLVWTRRQPSSNLMKQHQ